MNEEEDSNLHDEEEYEHLGVVSIVEDIGVRVATNNDVKRTSLTDFLKQNEEDDAHEYDQSEGSIRDY